MTKLLEEAIARIRRLPDADQDEAAEILLTLASKPAPLDDATRAAIREGRAQARRGEFARDEEIDRLFQNQSE
jgi:predicted transcriptional regulator